MSTKLKKSRGSAYLLGAHKLQNSVNFALFSENATAVSLCIFKTKDLSLCEEFVLHQKHNRTGNIWHIAIENLPKTFDYGFRLDGKNKPGFSFNPSKIVLDPYAKNLSTLFSNRNTKGQLVANFEESSPFDWEDEVLPSLPMKDLIIYEMHVGGFTKDKSSSVRHPGTFLGVIEKIPYLKELGINAVELLPIFAFKDREENFRNPLTNEVLSNYWGYSPVSFFALMHTYKANRTPYSLAEEFKMMVKELHKNKIEVILDVVYNHTAEGNQNGDVLSFKGIDDSIYYHKGPKGEYLNFSGCGNTLNCNHPVVTELILDSLRFWVSEMHVDGFRFDLASILTRGTNASPLKDPPLLKAILQDPILSKCKLIAEPWDAAGLYQVGSFCSSDRWSEWNGKFRDVARHFMRGDAIAKGAFATAICGSEDLYGPSRRPYNSINFITAHDGFTLKDLVSYNQKHNEENGEDNRDGTNDNISSNYGIEGPSTDPYILDLRLKQMKNFHATLLLSIGTPLIHMGDEYGHSRNGNNNAWCQDNRLSWFQWDSLAKEDIFFRFLKKMIRFRSREKVFQRESFLKQQDVQWHGLLPFEPEWNKQGNFIAYTLRNSEDNTEIYIAFNMTQEPCLPTLPPRESHKKWHLILDTSEDERDNFEEDFAEIPIEAISYPMNPQSIIVLKGSS